MRRPLALLAVALLAACGWPPAPEVRSGGADANVPEGPRIAGHSYQVVATPGDSTSFYTLATFACRVGGVLGTETYLVGPAALSFDRSTYSGALRYHRRCRSATGEALGGRLVTVDVAGRWSRAGDEISFSGETGGLLAGSVTDSAAGVATELRVEVRRTVRRGVLPDTTFTAVTVWEN